MTLILAAFVAAAILLGVYVLAVLPASGWRLRAGATLLGAVYLITFATMIQALGRPKPIRIELAALDQSEVISALPIEDEAIYLWLRLPNEMDPRAYVMPWDLQQAQELMKARGEAEEAGTGVKMGLPSDEGLDDREPMFYAEPQPPSPLKGGAQ